MNVFIGGDSRCSHGCDETAGWSNIINAVYPSVKLVYRRSSSELVSYTIYDSDPFLKNFQDKFFDIAIIQSGWNERVAYYSEGVFDKMLGKHFNVDCRYDIQPSGNSSYSHLSGETAMFDLIKLKATKVVYIGFHDLSLYKNLEGDIGGNARRVNEVFSSLATDYLALPQDVEWAEKHCAKDGIHYNSTGIYYICDNLEKWLRV